MALSNAEKQRRFRAKHGGVNLHRAQHGRGETDIRHHLKKTYGITLTQYEAMLAAQGEVCAICGGAEAMTFRGKLRRLSVDHCHATGRIRGLLCSDCNTTLGKVGEDVERLLAMVAYLKR